MPTPYVKDLAKSTGKSVEEVEKLWDKAKEQTSKELNVPISKFGNKEYAYTTGILKKMTGQKKEDSMKALDFLNSNKGAADFVEDVTTSGQFNIPNVVNSTGDKDGDSEAFKTFNDDDLLGLRDVAPMHESKFRVVKTFKTDVLIEDKRGNTYLVPKALAEVEGEKPLNEPADDDEFDNDDALYFPDPALTTYEMPSDQSPVDVKEKIAGEPFTQNLMADVGFINLRDKSPNPNGTYTNAEEKRMSQYVAGMQDAYDSNSPMDIDEEIEDLNAQLDDDLTLTDNGFDDYTDVRNDVPSSQDNMVDMDDADDMGDSDDMDDAMESVLRDVSKFLREADNDEYAKEQADAQKEVEKEVEDKKKEQDKQADDAAKERDDAEKERDKESEEAQKDYEQDQEDRDKEEGFSIKDINRFLKKVK